MKKLLLILPVIFICCGSPQQLTRPELQDELKKLSQVAENSGYADCSLVLLTLRASMNIHDESTVSTLCAKYALWRLKQIEELEQEDTDKEESLIIK